VFKAIDYEFKKGKREKVETRSKVEGSGVVMVADEREA